MLLMAIHFPEIQSRKFRMGWLSLVTIILINNTVSGNSGLGISVLASTGNQITNNMIGTNTLGGISVTNSMQT